MFEILKTKDGSDTVFSKQYNATYHSIHGAVRESNHVFIENGLRVAISKFDSLSILEIGLGTALNLFLTLKELSNKPIRYTAIEKFPLSEDIYSNLSYAKEEGFIHVHQLPWNEKIEVKDGFVIKKINADFLEFKSKEIYNLVYLDAFAPTTQNELWQVEVLHKIFHMMAPQGILVTYCAKGELKRNLKSVGFIVETLAGPPGKREMTRAIRP